MGIPIYLTPEDGFLSVFVLPLILIVYTFIALRKQLQFNWKEWLVILVVPLLCFLISFGLAAIGKSLPYLAQFHFPIDIYTHWEGVAVYSGHHEVSRLEYLTSILLGAFLVFIYAKGIALYAQHRQSRHLSVAATISVVTIVVYQVLMLMPSRDLDGGVLIFRVVYALNASLEVKNIVNHLILSGRDPFIWISGGLTLFVYKRRIQKVLNSNYRLR